VFQFTIVFQQIAPVGNLFNPFALFDWCEGEHRKVLIGEQHAGHSLVGTSCFGGYRRWYVLVFASALGKKSPATEGAWWT
jgi:hypothetical protein